jgi:hypothetical protein
MRWSPAADIARAADVEGPWMHAGYRSTRLVELDQKVAAWREGRYQASPATGVCGRRTVVSDGRSKKRGERDGEEAHEI